MVMIQCLRVVIYRTLQEMRCRTVGLPKDQLISQRRATSGRERGEGTKSVSDQGRADINSLEAYEEWHAATGTTKSSASFFVAACYYSRPVIIRTHPVTTRMRRPIKAKIPFPDRDCFEGLKGLHERLVFSIQPPHLSLALNSTCIHQGISANCQASAC